MRYPNLIWAISQWGPRYKFAATLGESESWLSRRLSGRVAFIESDRKRLTIALGYPSDWLFQIPTPPNRARRNSAVVIGQE
jgi:hypothetical protein